VGHTEAEQPDGRDECDGSPEVMNFAAKK